jgi:hypothetical protein
MWNDERAADRDARGYVVNNPGRLFNLEPELNEFEPPPLIRPTMALVYPGTPNLAEHGNMPSALANHSPRSSRCLTEKPR